MSKYNASYFIKRFEKIHTSRWIVGEFNKDNKCCALGHLGVFKPEALALDKLFHSKLGLSPLRINDGDTAVFPQKTPRARILAALRVIEKLEIVRSRR